MFLLCLCKHDCNEHGESIGMVLVFFFFLFLGGIDAWLEKKSF